MEKLFDVYEVAEILSLNDFTIRKYFREGTIPNAFRLGTGWRIKESDLEKFVEFKINPKLFLEKEIKALEDSQAYKDADETKKEALVWKLKYQYTHKREP